MFRCRKCRASVEIGAWPWCPHGQPTFRVDRFEPYVDEHISTDGRPVEIRDRGQLRRLQNDQWEGDFRCRLRARPPMDLKRRTERIMDLKLKDTAKEERRARKG